MHSHLSRCVALGAGRLHMCTRGARGDERADRARAAALYPLSAAALLLNALCLKLLDSATRHATPDETTLLDFGACGGGGGVRARMVAVAAAARAWAVAAMQLETWLLLWERLYAAVMRDPRQDELRPLVEGNSAA